MTYYQRELISINKRINLIVKDNKGKIRSGCKTGDEYK